MRKLKTALSLTLALVLSLALTVPALAAQPFDYADDWLTITNVTQVSDWDGFGLGLPINCIAPTKITLVRDADIALYLDRVVYNAAIDDIDFVELPIEGGIVSESHTRYEIGTVIQLTEPGEYCIRVWQYNNINDLLGTDYYITVEADSQSTTSTQPEQPEQPTTPVVPADGAYKVSTSAGNGLNVRTGPGTNYKKAAPALREGAVIEIVEIQGQWGKLANDAGWVFMPGTKAVSEPAAPAEPEQPAEPAVELPVTLQVSTSAGKGLNVRTGPGTNYKLASAALREGTVIEVVEIDGQWGKLADDAGWVFLPGTKAVKN